MGQSEIKVQFEQLVEFSERLNEIAGKMKKGAEDTGLLIVCKTKGAWKSESADLFVAGEIKALQELAVSAEKVKHFAKQLYEKAEKIYEMEQQNVRTANIRWYLQ